MDKILYVGDSKNGKIWLIVETGGEYLGIYYNFLYLSMFENVRNSYVA